MAHSYLALIRAIETALTTDTGASLPRRIPTDKLFKLGLPPTLPALVHARNARVIKRCFVSISDQAVDDLFLEMGDEHRYDSTVSVTRWYAMKWEGRHEDMRAVMVEAADDFTRIRKALCWPAALQFGPDGDEVGLAGHALQAAGARDVLDPPRALDARTRVVRASARFRASFFLDVDREHTSEFTSEFT